MEKSKQNLNKQVLLRMKKRPYYAYLYAVNILKGRLPPKAEEVFADDPESAYKYARDIIKGRLPLFVHNALIINSFEKKDTKRYVSMYLDEFCQGE
jgi:hypothetical protein